MTGNTSRLASVSVMYLFTSVPLELSICTMMLLITPLMASSNLSYSLAALSLAVRPVGRWGCWASIRFGRDLRDALQRSRFLIGENYLGFGLTVTFPFFSFRSPSCTRFRTMGSTRFLTLAVVVPKPSMRLAWTGTSSVRIS